MMNLRRVVAQVPRNLRSAESRRNFSFPTGKGGSGSSGSRPWFPRVDPSGALACFIYGALVHASWDTYLVMKVEKKAAIAWEEIDIQLQRIDEELQPKLAGRDKQLG